MPKISGSHDEKTLEKQLKQELIDNFELLLSDKFQSKGEKALEQNLTINKLVGNIKINKSKLGLTYTKYPEASTNLNSSPYVTQTEARLSGHLDKSIESYSKSWFTKTFDKLEALFTGRSVIQVKYSKIAKKAIASYMDDEAAKITEIDRLLKEKKEQKISR